MPFRDDRDKDVFVCTVANVGKAHKDFQTNTAEQLCSITFRLQTSSANLNYGAERINNEFVPL